MKRKWEKSKSGLTLTIPSIIFVFSLLIYPIVYLFTLSFKEYSPLRSSEIKFVGLENYKWLFTSEQVGHSIWLTIVFTVSSVLVEVIISLFIAVLLSKLMIGTKTRTKSTGSKIFYSIFLLPFATPAVAAAIAWKMLLHPLFGPVNDILNKNIAWFTNYPMVSVVIVDAWKMIPMVLFLVLAAIMSIDPDQFEAAKMDGANGFQEFIYLTMPSIKSVLSVTVAFRAVDAFTKVFDVVYMTTGGGPGNKTEVFPLLIWKTAFSHLHFGKASALAIVAIIISSLLGILLISQGKIKHGKSN